MDKKLLTHLKRKFTYKLTRIMNVKTNFLFFCMIFVGGTSFAQNNTEKLTVNPNLYSIKPVLKPVNTFYHKLNTTKLAGPAITAKPFIIVSPGYYTQNFGFFCKKELQLEKITKIPFRFRLGSVQQCDWMEGKAGAVRAN